MYTRTRLGVASASAIAALLLATPSQAQVIDMLPPEDSVHTRPASDFVTVFPGVPTAREAAAYAQLLVQAEAINSRGPVDVQALISGQLPAGVPGVSAPVAIPADWIRYNALKYSPHSLLLNDAGHARLLGFADVPAFPTFGAIEDRVAWPGAVRDKLLVSEINDEMIILRPVYAGDTLYPVLNHVDVIDITPSTGSSYRSIVFVTQALIYNQRGEVVYDLRYRTTENVRQLISGPVSDRPSFMETWEAPDWEGARARHRYTDSDWAFIESVWRQESARGAIPLYWEDVSVGDRPAWTLEGPIIVGATPIGRWPMGGGGSRTLKAAFLDPATRARMVRDEATGIYSLPNRVDNVPPPPSTEAAAMSASGIDEQQIHQQADRRAPVPNFVGRDFAARHVMDWAGDNAWLQSISWTIMGSRGLADLGTQVPSDPGRQTWLSRVPSMAGRYVDSHPLEGDVALVKSEVVDKYVENGAFLVELVWWIETIDGAIVQEGSATMRLPSRNQPGPVLPIPSTN